MSLKTHSVFENYVRSTHHTRQNLPCRRHFVCITKLKSTCMKEGASEATRTHKCQKPVHVHVDLLCLEDKSFKF